MNQVKALEQQLTDAKQLVAEAEMARKLHTIPEFRKLIMEKFMVEECARYARESGAPGLDANARADALAISQSAGHLKRFLSVIMQMGDAAERQLEEIEEMIVEAQAEEDAEDGEGEFEAAGDI